MTRFFQFFNVLVFFFTVLSPQSFAQGLDDGQNVAVRALPERSMAQAGEIITIGVEQSIRDHWHTYWQNPGDSGAPPTIAWDMPDGFTMGDIVWPTPQKLPYAPLLNYGYENNVVLLQELTVPDTYNGSPVTITGQVDILVCKEECIPEFHSVSFTLNNPNTDPANYTTYFNKARDALPLAVDWDASYTVQDNNVVFTINTDRTINQTSEIFPIDWGLIDNAAPVTAQTDGDTLTISQARGNRDIEDIGDIDIVLAVGTGDTRQGFGLRADYTVATENSITPVAPSPEDSGQSLLTILFLAMIGGVILNLMPCVFPVLSLKALKLVKTAHADDAHTKQHGLAYTFGILITFTAIAGVILVLKALGNEIGWGFQLQNPIVVGLLAYLLFVIGLNLLGLFEIGTSLTNVGSTKTQNTSGIGGSFWTGVLATIVATPCTAPFMAGAIGYAFIQPPLIALSVFWALGFGLALPFLLISFIPSLGKYLPKPGAWMDTFKNLMAFPILLSAAWLVSVVAKQGGDLGVLIVLTGMTLLGFVIWLHRRSTCESCQAKPLMLIALAIGLLWFIPAVPTTTGDAPVAMDEIKTAFTPDAYQNALQSGDVVFTEMTAAWCISCKVNYATSININSTQRVLADNDITYLQGDWTNQDTDISAYLKKYGRNGVPLYVVYGKPDANGIRPDPVVLPQILTPGILQNALTQN